MTLAGIFIKRKWTRVRGVPPVPAKTQFFCFRSFAISFVGRTVQIGHRLIWTCTSALLGFLQHSNSASAKQRLTMQRISDISFKKVTYMNIHIYIYIYIYMYSPLSTPYIHSYWLFCALYYVLTNIVKYRRHIEQDCQILLNIGRIFANIARF